MNIDGLKMKEIISYDSYKKEVLERLKYAEVILKETKKELVGTNFESLLWIIKTSCIQLQNWIDEYKKNESKDD